MTGTCGPIERFTAGAPIRRPGPALGTVMQNPKAGLVFFGNELVRQATANPQEEIVRRLGQRNGFRKFIHSVARMGKK